MARAASCLMPLDPHLGLPSTLHIRMEVETGGNLSSLGTRLLASSGHFETQRSLAQTACGSIPTMDPATGDPWWIDGGDWHFNPREFDPPSTSPFYEADAGAVSSWVKAFSKSGVMPPALAELLERIPLLDRIGLPDGLGFGAQGSSLVADVDELAAKLRRDWILGGPDTAPLESFPILCGARAAEFLGNPSVYAGFGPTSDYAYRHAQGRWLAFCVIDGPRNWLGREGLADGAWLPVSQLLARHDGVSNPTPLAMIAAYVERAPTQADFEDLFSLWSKTGVEGFFKGHGALNSVMEQAFLAKEFPQAQGMAPKRLAL